MEKTEAMYESPEQMAARYNIKSVETIMRRLRKGEIPGAIKVGRLWRIPIEVATPTPPPPPLSAEDTAGDPEITAAQKENALQKVKTDTAIEAVKERKAKMELQGCHDCEALQKSTIEKDAELEQREALLAQKETAFKGREARAENLSAEATRDKQIAQNIRSFGTAFKQDGYNRERVVKLLGFIRSRFYATGMGSDDKEGLDAVKSLERIWLRQDTPLQDSLDRINALVLAKKKA